MGPCATKALGVGEPGGVADSCRSITLTPGAGSHSRPHPGGAFGTSLLSRSSGSAPMVGQVTEQDRLHWDEEYSGEGFAHDRTPGPPTVFAAYEHFFPKSGQAIDLACGRGMAAVWLAERGLTVHGVDGSPVAVRFARDLAERNGVGDRCTFDVVDLDVGLPGGPPVDVIVCYLFRDARLYKAVIEVSRPGGCWQWRSSARWTTDRDPLRCTR